MRCLFRDIMEKRYVFVGYIVAFQRGTIHHRSIKDDYWVVVKKAYDCDLLLPIVIHMSNVYGI